MAESPVEKRWTHIVLVGSYPMIFGLCLALYALLSMCGVTVTLASYGAVLFGAAMISLHENKLSYRAAWKPSAGEVVTDALFMLIIQIALPYLLSVSLVLFIADQLAENNLAIGGLWPHHWPIWVQVALMLLTAEFFRYWMHRAFHKFTPLWRFHAVHHSPHRLYWLNVGRFHPIEKAIQYLVDALPFALVGVSKDVLAIYFIVYALNGFFQHSNCRVRLGFLNFVVSGPELHRWHHSYLAREADNNFGNNLILWDLVFGTRFLPGDREVGALGLPNREYPTGFLTQMKSPFIRGLEKG